MTTMDQHNQQLKNIMVGCPELKPHLDDNFILICSYCFQYGHELRELTDEDLDHIALVRAIELTNGCIQMAFRFKRDYALSVEETRKFMKYSMGIIKSGVITLPNSNPKEIVLSKELKRYIEDKRSLYIKTFKTEKTEDNYLRYFSCMLGTIHQMGTKRFRDAFTTLTTDGYYPDDFITRGYLYVSPYLSVSDAMREM